MTRPSLAALLLITAAGCAGQPPLVRADDMSAAQHRSAAAREQTVAARETQASGAAAAVLPAGAYDPGAEHRRAAEELREHARQHQDAAAFLEQFEDEQCAGIAPSSRAACPLLGPLVSLADVPGGVRATFADPSRVPGAIAEMRCHYAFSRARHFEERVSCPLYVGGIEIRRGLDPRAVEIIAHDDRTVRLIRARSRAEAVVVRGDLPRDR